MTASDITLTYYYSHASGGVIEKHIDNITGELLDSAEHTGNEGDPYDIPSKTFKGYELVSEKKPTNAKGTMARDIIEVKYYYNYPTKVIAKYVDKITGKDDLTKALDFISYKISTKFSLDTNVYPCVIIILSPSPL